MKKQILIWIMIIVVSNILNAQKWSNYSTIDGLANNKVYTIAIDSFGAIWCGTNDGISTYDDSKWSTINTSNGLRTNPIYTIAIDENTNRKWFNNCNGYMSYNNNTFSYSKINGCADNCFSSCPVSVVFVSNINNAIWVGMSPNIDGFSIIGKGGYSSFNSSAEVISIAEEKNGNTWFGTMSNGTMVYYGGDKNNKYYFSRYNTTIASNRINAIAVDNDNNKWFGTDKGVSKFDNVNWTTYDIGWVLSIAKDKEGNLWFGTGSGVKMYDGNNWVTYTTSDGLVNNTVNSIAIDSHNNKWFGTNNGVSKFESGSTPSEIKVNKDEGGFVQITPTIVVDFVNVSLASESLNGELSLFSINGDELLQLKVSSNFVRINMSDYSTGVYFLKLTTISGGKTTKKIVKK
jgi:ligand-binding sensor domain-containing protein